MGALSVYGVAVVITYILVTFTNMGYMDNVMDSNTFLSYFLFIMIQGKLLFLKTNFIIFWFNVVQVEFTNEFFLLFIRCTGVDCAY